MLGIFTVENYGAKPGPPVSIWPIFEIFHMKSLKNLGPIGIAESICPFQAWN